MMQANLNRCFCHSIEKSRRNSMKQPSNTIVGNSNVALQNDAFSKVPEGFLQKKKFTSPLLVTTIPDPP